MTWLGEVSPLMSVHVDPSADRCHWKAYVFSSPDQAPGVAVNTDPRCGDPVMAGAAVLTGAPPVTEALGVLAALTEPSGFTAVTSNLTCEPSSATVSLYVGPVAPAMSVQVVPSAERCH